MLSDDQYERIGPLLPGKSTDPGRTAADNRLFVEAVLWIARTGSPWRDLPPDFGPWNRLYQRFARWSRADIWHAVFAELARDADLEEIFIGSTIVRAHQHAAGAAKKRRPVDRALAWRIEYQDSRAGRWLGYARSLSPDGRAGRRQSRSSAFAGRTETRQSGCRQSLRFERDPATSGIDWHSSRHPSRANRLEQRPLDEHLYASRNLVERFFCRIKQFRRVATRYDKLSERFSSFVTLSASFIWTC
jgi:transposase